MAKTKGFILCIYLAAGINACGPVGVPVSEPEETRQLADTATAYPFQNVALFEETPPVLEIAEKESPPIPNKEPEFVSLRSSVAETFIKEVGVVEYGGNNRGTRVEEYLRSTNLGPGHAWCAAFVHWTLRQHGIDTGKSNAWSPSWFPPQNTVYKRNTDKKDLPRKSDVFGLYYTNLGRIGHVGFVEELRGDVLITVEGNTNGQGSREGDGVHRKRRPWKTIYAVSDWIGNG
jgi:hypothetical protein